LAGFRPPPPRLWQARTSAAAPRSPEDGAQMGARRLHRRPDAGIGEIRNRAQGFFDRRARRDVAPRDAQHGATAPCAQHALGIGERRGGRGAALVFGAGRARVGLRLLEPGERVRILKQSGSGELARRHDPRELARPLLAERLESRGQAAPISSTLAETLHRFVQALRHRFQPTSSDVHARGLNHIPIGFTVYASAGRPIGGIRREKVRGGCVESRAALFRGTADQVI